MKSRIFKSWKLALPLAALPVIAAGYLQSGSQTTPTTDQPGDTPASTELAELTTPATQPEPVSPAPAEPVATAAPAANESQPTLPPDVKLSATASQVVKLTQSGVAEEVMLAYVGNQASRFNLGPEQIVYLNDIGVPGAVVKAMLDRDSSLNDAAARALAALAPTNTPPPMATPAESQLPPTPAPAPAVDTTQDYTDYASAETPVADNSDYFYDSLAPYGSWIVIGGYGRCWRPTACVVNSGWHPYCDHGHWVWSDCGWYWESSYTWGWAPFHYGRWQCDNHAGWVWVPGTVWGPAWVSWRHSADYCGWAPLPPAAHYVAGVGFTYHGQTASANAEFGLHSSHYVFVSTPHFTDPVPSLQRLSSVQVANVFNHTTVNNNMSVEKNRFINRGVDPATVASASHREIRKVTVRDVPDNSGQSVRSEHVEHSGRDLVVYRSHLPAAPGVKQQNAPNGVAASQSSASAAHIRTAAPRQPAAPTSFSANSPAQASAASRPLPAVAQPPMILHGATPPGKAETYPANSVVVIGHRQNNDAQSRAVKTGTTPALPNMNLAGQNSQNGNQYPTVSGVPAQNAQRAQDYQAARAEYLQQQNVSSAPNKQYSTRGSDAQPQWQAPARSYSAPAPAQPHAADHYQPNNNSGAAGQNNGGQNYHPSQAPAQSYHAQAPAQTYHPQAAESRPAPAANNNNSSSSSSGSQSSNSRGPNQH